MSSCLAPLVHQFAIMPKIRVSVPNENDVPNHYLDIDGLVRLRIYALQGPNELISVWSCDSL